MIEKLISAGVNAARLNFSHGTYSHHAFLMANIREAAEKLGIPVAIIQDLQGPRVRVGDFLGLGSAKAFKKDKIEVEKGETVIVADEEMAQKIVVSGELVKFGFKSKPNDKIIPITYPHLTKTVKKCHNIFIDDKFIELAVEKVHKNYLECIVVKGGSVLKGKGINFPDSKVDLPTITKKDKEDIEFGISQNVDFIALSFVRSNKDIKKLRRLINRFDAGRCRKSSVPAAKDSSIKIIAKIERLEAINNFDKILRASDAIMVARGDLGIEMPESKVAILQKEIINKCIKSAKPVIVATQMLDSMIRNSNPTRAEVSDVSNAVIDHTDAVMLSGETAEGKYPVESVEMMSQIIIETEYSPFDNLPHNFLGDEKLSLSAALADSAHELAKNSKAKAIVVASVSGFTARMIARHRPETRIIVMTNNKKTHLQMSLIWGVESYVIPEVGDLDDLIDRSIEEIKSRKLLEIGDRVVILTGRPHLKKEHMSLVKVQEIK